MSEYQSISTLDLANYIQSGDTIVVGQGIAEPIVLSQALIDQRDKLGQVNVFIGPLYQSPFSAEQGDRNCQKKTLAFQEASIDDNTGGQYELTRRSSSEYFAPRDKEYCRNSEHAGNQNINQNVYFNVP